MPHIVLPFTFKSKKAFKEAVEAGRNPFCEDPSIFPGSCSGTVIDILNAKGYFTVTNHPKRSWFASVERINGKVVVK